ncbi:MAG: glycosyltransferase [Bacteroidales bacterium]|nr:glycosyltransferase [Bacteroidales bacterium]
MLIGYEANNAMRNGGELGDFSRTLIERLASRYIRNDYRALLFSTRIKSAYRGWFSGHSNVSTYLPVGIAKLLPEAWLRYRLNPMLKAEKVKIFHGLNEELPYHIGREIKTVITCYGTEDHHRTSVMDSLLWKKRMHYSFSSADVVVAVSEEVRQHLLALGVDEKKVVVIGVPGHPYEVNEELVERYFALYQSLIEE